MGGADGADTVCKQNIIQTMKGNRLMMTSVILMMVMVMVMVMMKLMMMMKLMRPRINRGRMTIYIFTIVILRTASNL